MTPRGTVPGRLLSIAALTVLLGACAEAPARLRILEGGFRSSRGAYNEAVAAYLPAVADPTVGPYAAYGLGTVYLALGENDAAQRLFAAAEATLENTTPEGGAASLRELRFRLRYNAAVGMFQAGDFAAAAAAFRTALELDGQRPEAKRNLELSLRALARQSSAAASSAPVEQRSGNQAAQVVFNFMRQKESDRWKSREWEAENASAADY